MSKICANVRRAAALGIALTALAGFAAPAAADIVFAADMTGGNIGAGWSKHQTSIAPLGEEFLGEFGNERVTFTLQEAVEAPMLEVSFDLYIIRSWDGNVSFPGQDIFRFGVVGGPTLLDTTFANQRPGWERPQAYPNARGEGDNPMNSGADAVNTLGYEFYNGPLDAVYHMTYLIEPTNGGLELFFEAQGLQQLSDESWGVDNVQIRTVPAPGALALLGMGSVLVLRRRKTA